MHRSKTDEPFCFNRFPCIIKTPGASADAPGVRFCKYFLLLGAMLSGVVQLFFLIHPLVGKALHLPHVDAFGRVKGIAAADAHRQGVTVDLVERGHHLADQGHLTGTGLRAHRAEQQGKFIAARTEGVVPAKDCQCISGRLQVVSCSVARSRQPAA